MTAIRRALEQAGIPAAAALAELALPALRIQASRVKLADLPMGASRLGGVPDLSRDFTWPTTHDERPLTFLAQLDLTKMETGNVLPSSGWLLFFYDVQEQPWGFDPDDEGSARVVHLDCSHRDLIRAMHPPVGGAAGPFEACALTVAATIDLPHEWDRVLRANGVVLEQADWERYASVASRVNSHRDDARYHHLLGHPQLIQGDMRGECELATNGIYCGRPEGYQGERARQLLATAGREWNLLLQLDTDEDGPGWMWGDAGRLYFWIRAADLAKERFDKVWLVLQCG